MVGCGGEERKGILFVFLCLYISEMSMQLGFSFLLYWCPKQKRMHCFWASGLLVQQQAYLYDTCNLNIQTNYQQENGCVVVFFYTESLLCAMFTESLKLCIWPFFFFFYNTGDSCMVLKKKIFCFFPSFSHFHPKVHFLPTALPLSRGPLQGAAGALVHTSVNCSAHKLRVKLFHLPHKGEIKFPK